MPLYEYECDTCGKKFEIIQRFSDPAPDACRLCGKGPVRRQLSSPAIQFKGSGFYITDYTKKSGVDSSAEPSKSDASKTETGGAAEGAAAAKSDAGTGAEKSSKADSGAAPAKSEAPAKAETKPASPGSTKSSSGGD